MRESVRPEVMMGYRAIVVGTDGSNAANETVRQGAALARSLGATLHIVSAFSDDPRWRRKRAASEVPVGLDVDAAGDPRMAAKAIAEDAAHEVRHRAIEMKLHVLPGDPAAVLCEVADRVSAELIMIGNRGVRSPLRRWRPPIFSRIERQAPCDVRVIDTERFRRPIANAARASGR